MMYCIILLFIEFLCIPLDIPLILWYRIRNKGNAAFKERKRPMDICTGQYRYLLSIYRLSKEKRRIRCVDIAADLGVTRPSVSKMMKCMVRMELVEPEYCEAVRLTPLGLELAEKYHSDYDMVYLFFRRMLRLTPAEAKDHAFQFLTAYPHSTVRRLSEVMQRSMDAAKKK
jgi:Mn-dependent DtxR family transcriptional regulator